MQLKILTFHMNTKNMRFSLFIVLLVLIGNSSLALAKLPTMSVHTKPWRHLAHYISFMYSDEPYTGAY